MKAERGAAASKGSPKPQGSTQESATGSATRAEAGGDREGTPKELGGDNTGRNRARQPLGHPLLPPRQRPQELYLPAATRKSYLTTRKHMQEKQRWESFFSVQKPSPPALPGVTQEVLAPRRGCTCGRGFNNAEAEEPSRDLRQGSEMFQSRNVIYSWRSLNLLPLAPYGREVLHEAGSPAGARGPSRDQDTSGRAETRGRCRAAGGSSQTKLPREDAATSRRGIGETSREQSPSSPRLSSPPLSPPGEAAPCSGVSSGVSVCTERTRQRGR